MMTSMMTSNDDIKNLDDIIDDINDDDIKNLDDINDDDIIAHDYIIPP